MADSEEIFTEIKFASWLRHINFINKTQLQNYLTSYDIKWVLAHF